MRAVAALLVVVVALQALGASATTGPAEAVLLALDSSGNGNHGTLVPSVVRAPGHDNQSIFLDGRTAFGLVSAADSLNATDAISATVWANRSTQSTTATILRRDNEFIIQAGGDTTTNFFVFVGGSYRSCSGSHPASFNGWHHFALTYDSDPAERILRGWFDGALACSLNIGALALSSYTVGPTLRWLHIGAVGTATTGDYFIGGIDEARLYSNRSLSDDALDSIINGTSTGTDDRTGMTVWLRFDEAWDYGPPVAAFSAVPHNLTLAVDALASSSPWPAGSLSYAWDWGDGSGEGSNVTDSHVYALAGTYVVTLTVTDAASGQSASQNLSVSMTNRNVVTLETAFDSWIPIVLWGLLLIFCLVRVAWFPATAALMNLMVSIMPTPLYGVPASVMLISVGLVLHVVALAGIVPVPWRKDS